MYIVDFYCHESRLVVGVDGGVYLKKEQREYDAGRTDELEKSGLKVIKFTNKKQFS